MFQGLEHTAIASPDPLRLAQWYVEYLEFHINFEYAGNYFVKAPNGTMLEIIPSEGEPVPQKMRDPGIRHLAIQVSDIQSAYDHLRSRGIEFLTPIANNSGNQLAFFKDGDGNLVHLIQREKPLP
jgi:glyoxylase I family protein